MTHSATCTGCPHCNPVFAALVKATPREQAQFNRQRVEGQRPAHAALTVTAASQLLAVHQAAAAAYCAAPPIEVVPDAPNLVAAINARRATPQKGIGTVPEPVFLNGYGPRRLQPPPTVNAQGGIDDPPSLTDAILSRAERVGAAGRRTR